MDIIIQENNSSMIKFNNGSYVLSLSDRYFFYFSDYRMEFEILYN